MATVHVAMFLLDQSYVMLTSNIDTYTLFAVYTNRILTITIQL